MLLHDLGLIVGFSERGDKKPHHIKRGGVNLVLVQ
jgi:hypothetical protein